MREVTELARDGLRLLHFERPVPDAPTAAHGGGEADGKFSGKQLLLAGLALMIICVVVFLTWNVPDQLCDRLRAGTVAAVRTRRK